MRKVINLIVVLLLVLTTCGVVKITPDAWGHCPLLIAVVWFLIVLSWCAMWRLLVINPEAEQ